MAWCHQAKSYYLSQRWSRSMSPNGVTRLRWNKDMAIDRYNGHAYSTEDIIHGCVCVKKRFYLVNVTVIGVFWPEWNLLKHFWPGDLVIWPLKATNLFPEPNYICGTNLVITDHKLRPTSRRWCKKPTKPPRCSTIGFESYNFCYRCV